MKLVVIGGAGVRAPLLMPALAKRQTTIDLREVVLVDSDEEKLSLMGPICLDRSPFRRGCAPRPAPPPPRR